MFERPERGTGLPGERPQAFDVARLGGAALHTGVPAVVGYREPQACSGCRSRCSVGLIGIEQIDQADQIAAEPIVVG